MISIKSIMLKNFRNYKDSKIELKDGCGVFFIYGNNGGGKTTLINAINWCLYGDIVFHGVNPTPVVKPSWAGENDQTEVHLIITEDDNQYSFRRTTSGFNSDGILTARVIDSAGNSSELQQPARDAIIKRILPENIKNLFFLSENFSNEILGQKSTNSLKSNVYKVSELDTINSAIDHLDLTRSHYIKNIDKATKDFDKIQQLNDDIDFATKKINENEEGIEEATGKIAEHKASLEKLEEILKSSKHMREIIEQRNLFQKSLADIDDSLERDDADITECLQQNYHKVLLLDGIEKYKAALNTARDQGRIPAPINPKIIQQSKDRGICECCGKPIDEIARNYMNQQQEKYEKIDKLKFLADGIHEFADIKERLKDEQYKLQDAFKSKQKNEANRRGFKEQLDKISEELDSVSEANLPTNPEERRMELERKVEKWEDRRRGYAQNIVDFKNLIDKSNNDLAKLMNSGGRDTQALKMELDKIDELKQLLVKLKNNAESIIRERIRDGVWQSFQKILPDTQFNQITIDEDYVFSFIDKYGYRTGVSNLCVGEAKTLALSLVSTLSNHIGYSDAPLFIDNLFHGIEASHFSDITKCIEMLADKKQIFITYLHSDKSDEGTRVSKNFNPTVIKQEIGVIKDIETGICNIREEQ